MPQFSYRARRRSGELVEGVLDVADRSAAVTQIERLGLFPVAVDTARGGAVVNGKSAAKNIDVLAFLPPTLRAQLSQKRRPRLQELATFTQQLANLLQSGMPLTVALNSMTHLESKGIPTEVSRELKQEVSEGQKPVRRHGPAAADFFGSVHQHGAGRRTKRFPGGGAAAHGDPLPAVRRGAGEIHLGDDLSGHRHRHGHRADRVLHVRHDAAVHDHF